MKLLWALQQPHFSKQVDSVMATRFSCTLSPYKPCQKDAKCCWIFVELKLNTSAVRTYGGGHLSPIGNLWQTNINNNNNLGVDVVTYCCQLHTNTTREQVQCVTTKDKTIRISIEISKTTSHLTIN
jgi:hypothetical protein